MQEGRDNGKFSKRHPKSGHGRLREVVAHGGSTVMNLYSIVGQICVDLVLNCSLLLKAPNFLE